MVSQFVSLKCKVEIANSIGNCMVLNKGEIIRCDFADKNYFIARVNYCYLEWKHILWANVDILKSNSCYAIEGRTDSIIIGINDTLNPNLKSLKRIKEMVLEI